MMKLLRKGLSVCGASTYQLMRNLSDPIEKSFAELVKLVLDHHQPPPSKIVQRFKFHTRVQKLEEAVGQFIAGSLSTVSLVAHWMICYETA